MVMNNKQQFDDNIGEIFIVSSYSTDSALGIEVYTTSWWRRLLFKIGINVFYKKKLYKYDEGVNKIIDKIIDLNLNSVNWKEFMKYPLTPNECRETKPE